MWGYNTVNCWHCKTELIWGGDHDLEEENIVTNLSCPKCRSFVEVYYPKNYEKHEADFSNDLKHHEEMYGQQEQEDLKESYKQSLASKKEREKK